MKRGEPSEVLVGAVSVVGGIRDLILDSKLLANHLSLARRTPPADQDHSYDRSDIDLLQSMQEGKTMVMPLVFLAENYLKQTLGYTKGMPP